MQMRYRYYSGGDYDEYAVEAKRAYENLVKERLLLDPERRRSAIEVMPSLDGWAEYVQAISKSIFWQYERNVSIGGLALAERIERMWTEAEERHLLGEFLEESDAEDVEKALCYYMASDFYRCHPDDRIVDFRLYFYSGALKDGGGIFSLEPYE